MGTLLLGTAGHALVYFGVAAVAAAVLTRHLAARGWRIGWRLEA
jgi:hypothetical protein